jgi:hypothetical protein
MEYIKITTELVYADKVNKNGWRIPKEELIRAFNKATVREMLYRHTFFITDSYKVSTTPIVKIEDAIGFVESMDIENGTSIIQINKSFIELAEKSCVDLSGYALFLNYTGKLRLVETEGYNTVEDLQIISAVFMPKKLSAYL